MEEIVLPVVAGDESVTAIRDDLPDDAAGHEGPLFSLPEPDGRRTVCSSRGSDHAEHRRE
jgi:hypothetical protein